MNEESRDFRIDVDKILRQKAGNKYKYIPRPVISWLKSILHQDEVNRYLTGRASGKYGMEWLDECVDYLEMDLQVRGLDQLPTNHDGRYYTIVSNHPLGGEDGVALGSILCHKYDSRIKYLVNDILMNLDGLAPLCIPINKTGNQSRNFPKMVDAAFQSDNNVLMFPAGLCSRKQNGVIRDLDWKKTFITKSIEYQRDVIPVHFSGQNSERFYRIANICKRLNLKVNIAMLFLVDEMYKNVGKQFTVTFGQPIPWQTFDNTHTHTQWAQWVKDKVYELEKQTT
ncbi:MAG: glycerol acyltransferase [Bacteroidaceae bacterium]|nr:glycerol acyltransferase [Bacteroidaceae bacterium]MBQ8674969.1 glycerol acyltransferase [Bacteroidaceae bacterium]MBQ9175390.1 glycerol acyltransferase [Bacteroidaceae bacterium]MBR1379673.1 glycerol acyltransferase [Bacteroidaceae bacterium]